MRRKVKRKIEENGGKINEGKVKRKKEENEEKINDEKSEEKERGE